MPATSSPQTGAPPPASTPSLAWREIAVGVWSILRLPLQLSLFGGALLLLLHVAASMTFANDALSAAVAALAGADALAGFVGILVFLVGIGFAAFLWWLASRFFGLISKGSLSPEALAALKDLPLALPEGTVRALLALIVAVVGLPLLLFSNVLHLTDGVAGYVNGIITGVFGFYFGTRTTTVPAQAVGQIADAHRRADTAEAQRDTARTDAQQARATADAAGRAGRYDTALDQLNRHLKIGTALVDVIAPALPAGVLPSGLKDAVTAAKAAVTAVQGVTGDTATDDHLGQITAATTSLVGSLGGGTSALGALLSTAAPMLGGVAIPGLGPLAGIATLVALGVRLGATEFQRWRARVLAAPIATGLIEFGTVTPDDAETSLADTTLFRVAFAPIADDTGLTLILADAVLRDDGGDRLWQLYGAASQDRAALFASRADFDAGLLEFRQALLARQSSSDVPAALPPQIATALGGAQTSAMKPPASLSAADANALIGTASRMSLCATAPAAARAAFDALILLTGLARVEGVDLTRAINEVRP